VLTAEGSSARQTYMTKDCPVDAVIVGVLDSLEVDKKDVYRMSEDTGFSE
jgi:ethanolamine utilization protein EutN